MNSEAILLCYAVTHDGPYPRYAAASIYSAVRCNPGIRVHLAELDGGDYPWWVMGRGLPETSYGSAGIVALDADTWWQGDAMGLFLPGKDINARVANVWGNKLIDHDKWYRICRHFEVPQCPVLSNGVIAANSYCLSALKHRLMVWINLVTSCECEDPLSEKVLGRKGRPAWWMRDQYALTLLCAEQEWDIGYLGAEHISWNYRKTDECGGIVHHLGKGVDPFGEDQWPSYVQTWEL